MAKKKSSILVPAVLAEMDRQKLSAYELGKRAGVPAATITRIQAGTRPDPQASTIEVLAAALGMEPVLRPKGGKGRA
jgi:transcriptional regulator with XRE-family HTH domain